MNSVFREVKTKTKFLIKNNLDFPGHVHDDIELAYVYEGECVVFCEGKKYILKPGMFFVSFPNQIHYYENCESNGKYFITIFKSTLLLQYKSIFDDRIPDSPIFKAGENTSKILTIVETFIETFDFLDVDMQSSILTLIFGLVLKSFDLVERSITRDSVSNVINYCAKYYKDDISISSVASSLNISKSYVSFIFGHYLLINFREYINTLRISEAMKMIEQENLSMTEISDSVGFNTLRTFNRAFYSKNGMSPSAYKKLIKGKR